LSVEENLELGAYILKDETAVRKNLDFIYDLFPRLKERRQQLSGTLSGGEQQMLAIGRGLMSNPKLLMLDEPSLGLMPKLVDEMLEAVAKLRNMGMTILLVEQNVFESLEIADRGYVLQTGRTILEGTGKELLNTESIKKAFLGL
jgi:branched-chain amino acid transport system ATP-binding protein